jgi:mycobactin peptide synthetase MbtF
VTSTDPLIGIEDVLALSPLQEGLFALSQLNDGGHDGYVMPVLIDIDGPLDAHRLHRSVRGLLQRHPNLRAVFWDHDLPTPVQIIPRHIDLPWRECSAELAELDAIVTAERSRPFDLSQGPALRVMLVTLPPKADGTARRRMIMTIHHILVDGWSIGLLFQELCALYQAGGVSTELPQVPPYRNYIGWLAAQDISTVQQWWRHRLHTLTGPLMIATGGTGFGISATPEVTRFALSATDTTRLRNWAGSHGLTLNSAVQFAWTMVLSRLVDRNDVVYGTVVTGRPEQIRGVDRMVGLFLNTIPVPFTIDPDAAIAAECARLQEESATMREFGQLSLSAVQRAAGYSSLFDTMFVFQNAPMEAATVPVTIDQVVFESVPGENLTHYPLTVVGYLHGQDLLIVVEAIRPVVPFRPADIGASMLAMLRSLPDAAQRCTRELDVVCDASDSVLSWPATTPRILEKEADVTVFELFQRQVAQTPDALALVTATCCLTYLELYEQATRLACELISLGVGPEDAVGIYLPRSSQSIVAILATFATGAAYVPIDTSQPRARVDAILRQAQPRLVIATERQPLSRVRALCLDAPAVRYRVARRAATTPRVVRRPEHSAYVMFTSGSTGEPKGVIGTHQALVSYFVDHCARVYRPAESRLGRKLRIAHAWSLSFDASWQPLVGLLDGHCIQLFGDETTRDAQCLVDEIRDHGIDMIDTTPSMFRQLAAAGLLDSGLTVLALGGESIDTQLWKRLRALTDVAVYNCYGPTETTVEAMVADVTGARMGLDVPTIGAPTAGMSAYVLDSRLRLLPVGAVGELYLAGPQLTRGYVARPDITAGWFVADPFGCGERMYRTGDLVRRLLDGTFAYLGRVDDQVKVRGYRIERSEIDVALRSLPGVAAAATSVVRRGDAVTLVGFVVSAADRAPDLIGWRSCLAERLPAYMLPARLLVLEQLPLNVNGKTDLSELGRLAQEALASDDVVAVHAGPGTQTERILAEVIAEVLDGHTPGVDQDLFDLGLDSIVAMAVVNKARRRGLAVTPRMVMTTARIHELAAAIDRHATQPAADADGGYGQVLPLPNVRWMYDQPHYRRFDQHVLVSTPAGMAKGDLEFVLQTIIDKHDTLRASMVETPHGPRLTTHQPGGVRAANVLTVVEFDGAAGTLAQQLAITSVAAIDELDPFTANMMRVVWLRGWPDGDTLFLTIHHLAVDVVSWAILIADLAQAWEDITSGVAPVASSASITYRRWCELMWQRADSVDVLAQCDYWLDQLSAPDPPLGRRRQRETDTWGSLQQTLAATPACSTARILGALTRDGGVREFLLAALTMTLVSWRKMRGQNHTAGVLIGLESHGRADNVVGADVSDTVGWFSTMFPVRLGGGSYAIDVERAEADPLLARLLLDSVVAHLASVPEHGIDFGLLQRVRGVPELAAAPEPQVEFNYLGRVDLIRPGERPWSVLTDPALAAATPVAPEPDLSLRSAISLIATIDTTPSGTQLMALWRWSQSLFTANEIDRLVQLWNRSVEALAASR